MLPNFSSGMQERARAASPHRETHVKAYRTGMLTHEDLPFRTHTAPYSPITLISTRLRRRPSNSP